MWNQIQKGNKVKKTFNLKKKKKQETVNNTIDKLYESHVNKEIETFLSD